MKVRVHAVAWLGLCVVSCDKPPKADPVAAEKSSATKSVRPPRAETAPPRDRLRGALQIAEGANSPEARDRALATIFWDALDFDRDLARDGLQRMTAGTDEKNRLTEHFAMRLAEEDPEAALAWAVSLATDEEKSLAFGRIGLVLSENDPQRAATILSDSGVAGRDFDVAVVQVIQRWAAVSPLEAAAWVMNFDPGEARSAGMKEIVAAWISKDPQAALTWISTIPTPALRREAELGAAHYIFEDPDSSLLDSTSVEIRREFEALKVQAAEKN